MTCFQKGVLKKRKEFLRLFHGDLFLQFIIFFFSFLFFVYSTNLRFHLLTFRRCSQLVPNSHAWRHIFSSSSNLQTAHTDSFSDDFLTVFVVMVAKLKLSISREEAHKKKKIDKIILSLYLIHLQYVQLIWVLFSLSRKDMALSTDSFYIIILYPAGLITITTSLKTPGTSKSLPKRLLPSQRYKNVFSKLELLLTRSLK